VQLDLTTDHESRAIVNRYLETGGMDPAAVEASNERLEDAGRADVRTYDAGSSSGGFDADAKIVKVEHTEEEGTSTLRSAFQRLPGAPSYTRIAP